MKRIVVLGAGLGGLPMAFEMRELLKAGEELTGSRGMMHRGTTRNVFKYGEVTS